MRDDLERGVAAKAKEESHNMQKQIKELQATVEALQNTHAKMAE